MNAGDFDIVRDGRRNRTEGQQEKREKGIGREGQRKRKGLERRRLERKGLEREGLERDGL